MNDNEELDTPIYFPQNKYGSELLIDVVELKYVKKFLAESSVHTLTYYDITFITEGEGSFSIDNRTYEAFPQDVFFLRRERFGTGIRVI